MASAASAQQGDQAQAAVGPLSTLTIDDHSKFPNCYPTLNPNDIYRAHISELLSKVSGVDAEKIYPKLSWTLNLEKGDLMLPVPALQVKGTKPADLATKWANEFPESDLIEKPVAAGTFLQFFYKPLALAQNVIPTALKAKSSFGTNGNYGLRDTADPSKGRKKIVVEFSSPNIAKPFHAGHLRSTIIGGFLANLYTVMGWEVLKVNYLGDWGKQYGLLANGFKLYGSEEELTKDPINHLFNVYVRVNQDVRKQEEEMAPYKEEIKKKREEIAAAEKSLVAEKDKESENATKLKEEIASKQAEIKHIEEKLQPLIDVSEDEKARRYFKSMEDGDKDALALWSRFRDLSIEKYKETYARLNIDFDIYSGESQVKAESMKRAYDILAEKKVSEDSQGAIIIDFEKHGAKKLGKAIIVRKDGTPLYLTRDIGAIEERDKAYNFDKMIYVVAAQQDLHLAQLFKTTELLGRKDLADKCQHINFGMVRGMSTRKGTVKFLNDILNDVADFNLELMKKNEVKFGQVADPQKTSDILGITAVMVQDMTGKRINGYDFNLEAMTSVEGDTGPYLQYAHARLCSIERKAAIDVNTLLNNVDLSLLTEETAVRLLRVLIQWPDVVMNTYKTLEPSTIITYLFKMTHALSSSYNHLQIVGSEEEVKKARLALYEVARQVLHNGMRLLGLSPVERM